MVGRVNVVIQKFRGGGVLTVADSLRGGTCPSKNFKGGVRVLQPLAENLRPPPLWMFLTPSLRGGGLSAAAAAST